MILPVFGAYAGGLNINDVAFSGLFARPPLAIALGPRRAHAVGWRSTWPAQGAFASAAFAMARAIRSLIADCCIVMFAWGSEA